VRSLRTRLALAFALVAAITSAGIGAVVYARTSTDLADRARVKAAVSARQGAFAYERLAITVAPFVTAENPGVPEPLRRAVAAGKVATFAENTSHGPVVWGGSPAANRRSGIFVEQSYSGDLATLHALERTLVEVGAAATLLGALLGVVLAGRLSLRLRRAATVAERVTAGALDARVNARGRDEVAALGAAMDRMAESLQLRLEREQRFVADVAHDLRTPLTGLMAAASLLPADQVGDTVRERVSRLDGLVNDLLEIARLEDGAATADLRWIDLDGFVHSVAARHPDVEVFAASPVRLLTDPRRLERVLENLLGNAERYGRPPIEVHVHPDRLEVADAGPGFSPEMLAHATERFARGDPARRGGGIGLGLAIASAQAALLSGRLEVANRPEGGALVTVRLPGVVDEARSGQVVS
jgi:signal transduction histidine kinase